MVITMAVITMVVITMAVRRRGARPSVTPTQATQATRATQDTQATQATAPTLMEVLLDFIDPDHVRHNADALALHLAAGSAEEEEARFAPYGEFERVRNNGAGNNCFFYSVLEGVRRHADRMGGLENLVFGAPEELKEWKGAIEMGKVKGAAFLRTRAVLYTNRDTANAAEIALAVEGRGLSAAAAGALLSVGASTPRDMPVPLRGQPDARTVGPFMKLPGVGVRIWTQVEGGYHLAKALVTPLFLADEPITRVIDLVHAGSGRGGHFELLIPKNETAW